MCNYVVANVIVCPLVGNSIVDNNTLLTGVIESKASDKKIAAGQSCQIDEPCVIEKKNYVYTVVCRSDDVYNNKDSSKYPTPIDRGELAVSVRNVDLYKLFPNNERPIGENWTTDKGKSAKNEIESEGTKIYSKPPLYSFVLNRQKIEKIKEYNKTTDYFDFKMSCETDTGFKCESEFLDKLFPENTSMLSNARRQEIWK